MGTRVGTRQSVVLGALAIVCWGTTHPPKLSRGPGYQGASHLAICAWVKNREKERRQGGTVEFRKLYPKCCLVERMSSLDAVLQNNHRAVQTGQVGSSSV